MGHVEQGKHIVIGRQLIEFNKSKEVQGWSVEEIIRVDPVQDYGTFDRVDHMLYVHICKNVDSYEIKYNIMERYWGMKTCEMTETGMVYLDNPIYCPRMIVPDKYDTSGTFWGTAAECCAKLTEVCAQHDVHMTFSLE